MGIADGFKGDISRLEFDLNHFGEEGWELVNIIPEVRGEKDRYSGYEGLSEIRVELFVAVFKRRKKN